MLIKQAMLAQLVDRAMQLRLLQTLPLQLGRLQALPVPAAGRAAQHCERERPAGARADDGVAAGHEHYFEELAETVARGGAADPAKIASLRAI
jgi:hypothetical protein